MLLGDEEEVDDVQIATTAPAPATETRDPTSGLQAKIVDFLDRETEQMHEKWLSLPRQKQGAVMQNVVGFTLVSSIFGSKVSGPTLSRARELDMKLQETLIVDLIRFLGSDECSQKHIDALLSALHGLLPKASEILSSTSEFGDNFRGATGIFVTHVADNLDAREKAVNSFNDAESKDQTDIDDDAFGIPSDERNEEKTDGGSLREELAVLCSEEAFRASTSALVALCSLALKDADRPDICGQFVGYLQGATKTRLMMMRPVIQDFLFTASDTLFDSDATEICEHLATVLLKGYDVERCEASVAVCVDALAALSRRWVSPLQNAESSSYSALMEVCETVYSHVTKIGFDKQVTSYTIRASLANLLVCILQVNNEYRKGRKQSALELFINTLKDNDIRVVFIVSQKLHVLFEIFRGERLHLKRTDEIEAALPSETHWTEGLAMRVHALGLVALASPSNISRIVFRIFETGQLSSDASRYACRALLTVAKASGLESQRELFRMFGAKLIFTWTEYYALDVFPYEAFGYDSIAELCEDVPEELIAQLLARDKEEYAEFVASQLGRPLDELLVQAFARITAYGFAWAIGIPARDSEPPKPSLAVRIQQRIGDDTYTELFSKNFQLIISILMELMHEEGTSERLLSKMADVQHIMKKITAEGYSDAKLAEPLQPYFKAKVIVKAIEHTCKHMENMDAKNDLWTPAMVTFVARRLFNTLHPSLGPVHTCGVIRNIRFLICLAGPKVHRGYQLQMLIHGLKPYVVDTSCAEDTVGILRYLLNNGRDYLAKNPSFVIGTFLSILTSIRDFTQASLEVVQQDKQTMSTLLSFRSWLAEYLTKFDFPTFNPKQKQAFQSIVKSAVGFRNSGNAVKDTKESELLRHLLDDDMSKDKLLDDTSRQLAFSLFCSNFTRPESFRDDIFGTDKESFEWSKSLLRICRRSDVNNGFLLWSARVLGRAYASTGQLHTEWMQEMEFNYPTDTAFRGDMTPKVGILRRLKALLFSDDKAVVRLIEASLTQIIHDEAMRRENTFQYVLTEDEYTAIRWEPTAATRAPTPQPISPFGDIQTPVDVWIKDVTTAMCTNMPDSPILRGLSQALRKVDRLAEELFPYITHILLTRNSEALRTEISNLFKLCFQNRNDKTVLHNTILIKTILYLRSQPRQREKEAHERERDIWLDIDYLEAARAACVCKMFKTALLFTEIFTQILNYKKQTVEVPPDLLLEIFKNTDDPDSFYGVSQTFSLETVMNNFEYEGNGWKSLSLRAANLESGIRLGGTPGDQGLGIIDSFNTLGMNGLSHSFLQNGAFASRSSARTLDNTYRSAWKLEQWDLPCPSSHNTRSASIYKALQTINNTIDTKPVPQHVDPHFLGVMKQITAGTQTGHTLGEGMRTLAMLTEMEEVFISRDSHQLAEAWNRLQSRSNWMETGKYVISNSLSGILRLTFIRYVDVEELMAMRQATFGSLAKRNHLRIRASIDVKKARYMEAEALVGCCKMARKHEVLQHALSAATQLNHIVQPCKDVGLDISGVATLQAANVLWEDGQEVPSIKMLLALEGDSNNASQSMVVGRAKLLAKLASTHCA
jgi:ataxia telangiectasia mutated family protein